MIPSATAEPKRIEAWEVLSYLSQGNPLLILTSLQQNPVQNKTNLTERIEKEIDPSTVAEIVSEQQDMGLIRDRPSPAKNQYETTLFGNLVLEAYSNLLCEIGWKTAKYIGKSRTVLTILKHLDGSLSALSELTEDASICASRSTINNHLSNLEEMGWVNRKPPYECSCLVAALADSVFSRLRRRFREICRDLDALLRYEVETAARATV